MYDDKFIEQLLAGDAEAFSKVYYALYDPIVQLICQYGWGYDKVADDAFNETCKDIIESPDDFRESFRSEDFVRAFTREVFVRARKLRQREARRRERATGDGAMLDAAAVEEATKEEAIEKEQKRAEQCKRAAEKWRRFWARRLTARERKVATAWGTLGTKGAAEKLNISTSNVRRTIGRIIEKGRDEYGEEKEP